MNWSDLRSIVRYFINLFIHFQNECAVSKKCVQNIKSWLFFKQSVSFLRHFFDSHSSSKMAHQFWRCRIVVLKNPINKFFIKKLKLNLPRDRFLKPGYVSFPSCSTRRQYKEPLPSVLFWGGGQAGHSVGAGQRSLKSSE